MLLVTGGSGFLGGEILRRAGDAAALGTYLTRPIEGGVALDVRDAGAVRAAVEGCERVIHTAYLQSDAGVVAAGSETVAAACAAAGARLVHVSTDVVFDGTLGRPYREHDRPAPVHAYGRAKLAAERAVARLCPDAAIVRTSLIYGGPGWPLVAHERGPLEVAAGRAEGAFFTDELRSPVQVADLAGALLELAEGDFGGVLHVAGADAVSRHELARLLVAARGGNADRVPAGVLAGRGLERPADCRLDVTLARELLRTRLRGVREVLA